MKRKELEKAIAEGTEVAVRDGLFTDGPAVVEEYGVERSVYRRGSYRRHTRHDGVRVRFVRGSRRNDEKVVTAAAIRPYAEYAREEQAKAERRRSNNERADIYRKVAEEINDLSSGYASVYYRHDGHGRLSVAEGPAGIVISVGLAEKLLAQLKEES